MTTDCDAIIIGGGPAGATAAILLAQAGWRIAVVEKTPFPRRKVCGEFVSATSWPLLRELGVAQALLARAGPVVRRVGMYAGDSLLAADMPWEGFEEGGRALGREHLDTLLLARAAEAGADVWQPWTLSRVDRIGGDYVCSIGARDTGHNRHLRSRIILAAHGSWESGTLPTQRLRYPSRASDLFAFKAHFRQGALPSELMPLVAFPGGYAGMVHTDGGRVTLSCCIRRDHLERCRRQWKHMKAGESVFAHIKASCRGVDAALGSATLENSWLSAGPIRPGIRSFGHDGIFTIGNAAGEAHPIVAEGISMAIQSAWLLCERLIARRDAVLSGNALGATGRDYARAWRRNFTQRIHVAALVAHLAMRTATATLAVAVLKRMPALLTLGAHWSGKAQLLRSSSFRWRPNP